MSRKPHKNRPGIPVHRPQPTNNIASVQQRTATHWQGPIPPPEALERFNSIIPNGAERILAMAESEQQHRMQYEARGLEASINESRRGQSLGAWLSVLCVVASVASVYFGAHPTVSIALVGIPLISVIRTIINRNSARPPATTEEPKP